MRLLIVSATEFEILPLLNFLEQAGRGVSPGVYKYGENEIGVLITGVGIAHTALVLGRLLRSDRVDMALQVGVAGSYSTTIKNGDLVEIVSDRFADLGVEEADGSFTDVFELGLVKDDNLPYQLGGVLNNMAPNFAQLPAVQGVTVNKVHGYAASIAQIEAKYNPQVESMEGAAFMLACITEGVRFSQVRSISNRVAPRNRADWELALAIENLNNFLITNVLA